MNAGNNELRLNSDYKRTNLGGKLYFYPGGDSEIMAEVNYYQSAYGIPTATAYYKQQYWRFKDWQRLMANMGGSFPMLDGGYVKARLYYVKYYNVLDAYKNDQFSQQQWESTFDNYSLGAFVLGMVPLGEKNQLQGSITYRDDDVSTQSDLNKPWEHYEHKTLSLRFYRADQAEFLLVDRGENQDGGRFTIFPAADFFSDRAVKAINLISFLKY